MYIYVIVVNSNEVGFLGNCLNPGLTWCNFSQLISKFYYNWTMDHIRKEMIVILALPHCDFKTPPPAVKMVLEVVNRKDKTITYAITIIIFLLFIFVKIISYGFVTVAHRCHGKRNNLAAKGRTSRQKEITMSSRHKRERGSWEVFSLAVGFFLFAVGLFLLSWVFFFLPWGSSFCCGVISFAETIFRPP